MPLRLGGCFVAVCPSAIEWGPSHGRGEVEIGGGTNTGLPPRTTSVWTAPAFIAETSEANRAYARKRPRPSFRSS